MKKNKLLLIAIISILFLSSCSNRDSVGNNNSKQSDTTISDAQVTTTPVPTSTAIKKYSIKSGIITFETTTEMSGMKLSGKKMLYFDDFGMKECEETYEDGVLTESFVSDGKIRFKLFHKNKTFLKLGEASNGIAMRFDWNEVSQKDKDAGLAKQGGKETIAGKDCETYILIAQTGGGNTTTKFAGWNHIVLLMELSSASMNSTVKAVKIEEGVSISADQFTIPVGYKLL